jgi:hypothetical protein
MNPSLVVIRLVLPWKPQNTSLTAIETAKEIYPMEVGVDMVSLQIRGSRESGATLIVSTLERFFSQGLELWL